jgi:F0F1-type ATP synthase membrane subunit b/b'
MNTCALCRISAGCFIGLLGFLICVLVSVTRADTTDAELDALEKQIRQLEVEQTEAERKAAAAAEEKRMEEERIRKEAEERSIAEAARKKLEEETARAEQERRDRYDRQIELAGNYMNQDKFDLALTEYQKLLNDFPEDPGVLDGIRTAQKYLNACNGFVGRWHVEPNGIKWEVHPDKTIHGTWLIFSSDGFWDCLSAREREFVTSWPDCPVCKTDYFILSEDGNTLTGIRDSTAMTGRRMPDSR